MDRSGAKGYHRGGGSYNQGYNRGGNQSFSSGGGDRGGGYHGYRGRGGDQSFSSDSSRFQQRGRGDSRGRGRGDSGGPSGGFPNKPVIVADTRPGTTCALVSNHFKMTVHNKELIHIYKVDFGTLE